jgi:flagellar hook protein FlgE
MPAAGRPAAADHRQPAQADQRSEGRHPAGQCQAADGATFDPTDSNSYNHSSGGITVYDSLGVSHIQVSTSSRAPTQQWTVRNYVDGQPAGPPPVTFDNSGKLTNRPARSAWRHLHPTTGAGQLNMTLDIGGSTQYGEKFALRNTQQDGYAAGKLNEITVSETGVVYARYSNGDDKPLARSLTTFNNRRAWNRRATTCGWRPSARAAAHRHAGPPTSARSRPARWKRPPSTSPSSWST